MFDSGINPRGYGGNKTSALGSIAGDLDSVWQRSEVNKSQMKSNKI